MASEEYKIISKEALETALIGFCIQRTLEIIVIYQNYSMDSANFKEHFHDNLRNPEAFQEYIYTDSFNISLFLETFYYVLFWTDLIFQSRWDKSIYFELRKDFYIKLFSLLSGLFGFSREQLKEIEDDLLSRGDEYSVNPVTSNISLMRHVTGLVAGEPMLYSGAAYAYIMIALTESYGNVFINRAESEKGLYIMCKKCSNVVVDSVKEVPFTLLCNKCKGRYEIQGVYWSDAPGYDG